MPLYPAMPRSIATVASRLLARNGTQATMTASRVSAAAGNRQEAARRNRACDDQVQPVQPAPQHEVPGGAVPQPAQQHRRHQIDVAPHLAVPVAAERDVDVIAQEPAQRDVPAAPEVGDVRAPCTGWRNSAGSARSSCAPARSPCRNSRRSRSRSAAHRTRRVPRLDEAQRRAVRRGGEADIGEVRERVRQHQLLRQAEQEDRQAVGDVAARVGPRGRAPAVAA